MKPIINFFFGNGYRCMSANFLKKFELRKMSSPFDYMFIDLETSLVIIDNNFEKYLSDIIFLNNSKSIIELLHAKYTNEIHCEIMKLTEKTMTYVSANYNHVDMFINQNYLDTTDLDYNIYNWGSICCHIHFDLSDKIICQKIKERCDRFMKIYNKYFETTVLFHMTKIINCIDITSTVCEIINMKNHNTPQIHY